VVDNIDAEVEQVFAVLFLGGDEGTDIQFEFVEYGFVHDAVTVDEMTEETVFFDRARFSSDISKLRVPLGLACIVYMALMF
jgi:fructose-1-phosphate kinase PfkB-like protein